MIKKIILFTLLGCFLLSSIIGAQEGKYHYKIISFDKGLNSHINLWNLSNNQASIARNIRFNEQYSSASKRPTMSIFHDGSAAWTSLHRYYKNSDATDSWLMTTGTTLSIDDDEDGTLTTAMTGLSDGERWTWLTYMDKAIGGNGSDRWLKYDLKTTTTANTDGARTASNLTAELGAPFVELNTGSNLDASSWYQYKMMFTDGTTTWFSSAVSNAILSGTTVLDTTLTDVPLGPSGTTARYIYRTEGQATKAALSTATFKLAITISDNTTVTKDDDVADASLTTTWSETSKTECTPPIGTLGRIHRERFFVAGNSTYPSYLYWSNEYNPDFFTSTDYEKIREDDGDKITFLAEQLGLFVIGKENSVLHYYTSDVSDANWYASPPFSHQGCIAPRSVANSPVGIIYLGHKGLYRFTGNQSRLMSDAVTPNIDDILETDFANVVGHFANNEYNMAYTSKASGAASNDRVLVYDTVRDAYALDYKNINCFASASSGADYGVLYAGDSTTDGYIWAFKTTPETLTKRYKSEIDAGTLDTLVSLGTESDPHLEIGWDITIDEAVGTIDGHSYGSTAIIDREATSGDWTSEVYRINASALDKLYWRENLGDAGDITVQLKTGSTSTITMAGTETEFTDPSGSDVSGETANDYIKFVINFETSDISYSPYIYASGGYFLRLTYSKLGIATESDFLSIWQGGWENFGYEGKKDIDRIKVYYNDESSGTLTINYKNAEGDISNDITIDLSQEPPYETEEGFKYEGLVGENIFTYYPPGNVEGKVSIGTWWLFGVSETGGDAWDLNRIEVRYKPIEDYE